ncbi:MAG: hypothetical protein AAB870_03290 [Patescibacteria group bacterium]
MTTQKRSTKKKDISEAEVAVLVQTLQKINDFCQQIDSQTNILIGLSLAIFVFASSTLQGGNIQLYSLVLAIFAAISALIGILVMHPPQFMRKNGGENSMMFIKTIARHTTAADYAQTLSKTLASREEIIRQFALETYNLSTNYYRPKRRLFNLAKDILFTGITLSLIIFIVSFSLYL